MNNKCLDLFGAVAKKWKTKSVSVAWSNVHSDGPSFHSIGMSILKTGLHGDVDLSKFVQSGLVSFTKAEVNRARSPLPLPLPVHLESVQVCTVLIISVWISICRRQWTTPINREGSNRCLDVASSHWNQQLVWT